MKVQPNAGLIVRTFLSVERQYLKTRAREQPQATYHSNNKLQYVQKHLSITSYPSSRGTLITIRCALLGSCDTPPREPLPRRQLTAREPELLQEVALRTAQLREGRRRRHPPRLQAVQAGHGSGGVQGHEAGRPPHVHHRAPHQTDPHLHPLLYQLLRQTRADVIQGGCRHQHRLGAVAEQRHHVSYPKIHTEPLYDVVKVLMVHADQRRLRP
mmetsp:Transcript_3862/g.11169  ORF Transcript_3862/g.11169 Transcript_3862/m.11169 type:complete len:213 (-) Transcript_3862:160-798(-)